MQLEDVLERIESRLVSLKISADAASREARKPDAIRNLRRAVKNKDRAGISSATLSAIAPVLKTSVAWLIEGLGPEENNDRTVVIDGLVGAGGEVNTDVTQAYGGDAAEITLDIPLPPGVRAYEVWGFSMLPKYDPGDVILCQSAVPVDSLLGGVAMVITGSYGRYIKRIVRGSEPGLYDLESFNAPTMKDQIVAEAAPIYVVVPSKQVRRPMGRKEIERRYANSGLRA